jgi:hypothetical protein
VNVRVDILARSGSNTEYLEHSMKHLISICLLPLLLAGCATTMEYGHKFGNWIGQSVDDLYSKLGTPSSTQPQPDGGKIISYERSEVVKASPESKNTQPSNSGNSSAANSSATASDQPVTNTATATPSNTRTISCTTRYRTDSTGVIRSWTFDGNGCKAHEEPAPHRP